MPASAGGYGLTLWNSRERINALGSISGARTLNLAAGNVVTCTLTGNVTWTFPSSGIGTTQASYLTLFTTQDGTGGWTQTWPASVKWSGGTAPTVTTTASVKSLFTFFTADQGASWLGAMVGTGFA